MRIETLILYLAIALLPQLARAESGCGVPSASKDGWKVAAPESLGLSSTTLCQMVRWLDSSKQGNVHAILVVRRGTLVFEHYFAGSDEHLGRSVGAVVFGPEVKHDERSVSKSITGLVVGIAIDRGWIKSVDEPVQAFFPEYADLRTSAKDRITLRHLLTMSSGLEWHELGIPYTSKENSEIRMDTSPEPYRFALLQPPVALPGQICAAFDVVSELALILLAGNPIAHLGSHLRRASPREHYSGWACGKRADESHSCPQR